MGGQSLTIDIVLGSILEVDVEAVVNAANSLGVMGGGVAGVLKRAAGEDVEAEARSQAPIPVGRAVLTSGGRTKFAHIIHAPTMSRPAMRISDENVALATAAALALAEARGLTSLALPGMGTGVGGVRHDDAAARMIAEIRAFPARAVRRVVLVDVDHAMVSAWRARL